MFNNMKNKIREKTGNDLPKFISHYSKIRNHHSRQSSISSVSSVTSEQSMKEDTENKSNLSPDDKESKQSNEESENANNTENVNDKPSDVTIDWEKKYYDKEHEWKKKEKIYVSDLLKQTKELQSTLSLLEESRKKYQCCQEEKDQLELYQNQEIMKLKQLLLDNEEKNNLNVSSLKDASSTIESLKQEVGRLRLFEEQVNSCQDDLECLRHTSEKERWNLTSQIAQHEETIRHLEERVSVLTHRTEADCQALGAHLSADERVHSLIAERSLLERRLEEAHIHLTEIKTTWSNKIATLETQVGRLSRQAGEESVERRRSETKVSELERKLIELEEMKNSLHKSIEKLKRERDDLAQEIKAVANVEGNENKHLKEWNDKYNTLTDDFNRLKEQYSLLEQTYEESEERYESRSSEEREKNIELNIEVNQLRDNVEKLKNDLEEERNVKEQTIFRNAQISQQVQLTNQELQRQQAQNDELSKKVSSLQELLELSQKTISEQQCQYEQMSISSMETELNERLKEMEGEMLDKKKSIKMLQQNLTDMKKTLQEELKSTDSNSRNSGGRKTVEDDINFKYMKHVLVKFLTGSNYEAQNLTRVVSSLLQLNSEEEKLLRETLEWRMSWFGIRPRIKSRLHPS